LFQQSKFDNAGGINTLKLISGEILTITEKVKA